MFKYIAKQLEPGTEEFSWVFDDDGLNPSSGSFNNTLFIFTGNDCRFNEDIYSECESDINNLVDDLYDYFNDGNDAYAENDSFANHLDYVEELGFNTDSATILHLDYCVKCAVDNDYPEALVAYLQAKTGKLWNTRNFSGYSQGDYCTLVYCEDAYDSAALDYYGNMWLGCGGEFVIGILEVSDEQDDEIDLSDLKSFEHLVDEWTYGYFVVDDIIWRGGDKLISELADQYDCSKRRVEVYVYENGNYVNAKDM